MDKLSDRSAVPDIESARGRCAIEADREWPGHLLTLAGLDGSLWQASAQRQDLRLEQKMIGSCSLTWLRARSALRFRRNWSQIRGDGVDVALFCLGRRGRLRMSPIGRAQSRWLP